MSCLKRALKIAHAAQQQLTISRKTQDTTPVLLFVEILNKYLYYFDQGLPPITPEVLKVSALQLLCKKLFLYLWTCGILCIHTA